VRARTHRHKYTHPHPHILRSNKQVVINLHAHMRLACTSIDLFFLLPYSLFIFIFDNPVALRFIRVDMLSTQSILSSETKIHTHTHNFFPFYFPCLELLCPEKMSLLSAHPLLACLPSCSLILFALVCVCVCVCACVYVRVWMCVYVSVYEIALRITCTGSCEPTKKKNLPTCTEFRTAELYVKDKNKAS
jgi:hypothetical protein